MPIDLFSALFATTVTAGGVVGYLKGTTFVKLNLKQLNSKISFHLAGSKPSLIAGLIFGGLLGVGTYMTSVNPSNYYLTLGTSTVLAGVMGTRFVRSGKFLKFSFIKFSFRSTSQNFIINQIYFKSFNYLGKFLPAGLISALSLSMVFRCVYTMLTVKDESKSISQ